MTPMTPFIRLAIWIGLATVYYVQVILFEIDCTIFYANLYECQVMADMKKVYDDLTIINLYIRATYNSDKWDLEK